MMYLFIGAEVVNINSDWEYKLNPSALDINIILYSIGIIFIAILYFIIIIPIMYVAIAHIG